MQLPDVQIHLPQMLGNQSAGGIAAIIQTLNEYKN